KLTCTVSVVVTHAAPSLQFDGSASSGIAMTASPIFGWNADPPDTSTSTDAESGSVIDGPAVTTVSDNHIDGPVAAATNSAMTAFLSRGVQRRRLCHSRDRRRTHSRH